MAFCIQLVAQDFYNRMGRPKELSKTVKAMLKKSNDPYLAMLIYRSTPLQNGFSPAELLMNRRL